MPVLIGAEGQRAAEVTAATILTMTSRPGWISDPHQGQLLSCAGVPVPELAPLVAARVLDGLLCVGRRVRGGALADPEADAERGRRPSACHPSQRLRAE